MWGNIGAALAPDIFIRIKRMYPDDPVMGWNAVFLLCALVQVVGALAALGVNSTKTIQVDKVKTA
jgi:hypothetical protein